MVCLEGLPVSSSTLGYKGHQQLMKVWPHLPSLTDVSNLWHPWCQCHITRKDWLVIDEPFHHGHSYLPRLRVDKTFG